MSRAKHSATAARDGARHVGQHAHERGSASGAGLSLSAVRRCARLLILLPLISWPPPLRAQEAKGQVRPRRVPTAGEEVGPGDVIRVDTDLVAVDVVVRDGAGRSVRGLRSSDFRLFEDGVERPVSFFSADTGSGPARCPLDLVFALDVSGSMTQGEMAKLRHAAALFGESLSSPDARFSVISFGMTVRLLQPLTGDRRKLDKAFDSAARDEAGLSTHAYDAVDDAVRMLARKGRRASGNVPVKRAVVVISDGFPVGDTVSPRTVIERANAANVTVYSVTVPSFSFSHAAAYGSKPLPTIFDLSGLVEETGGLNVYAAEGNYAEALKVISTEVLSRYVLAFYPNGEKRRDGRAHRLSVEAPVGLTVSQSRRSYVGKGSR